MWYGSAMAAKEPCGCCGDRPWRGFSNRTDACDCGAGAPCALCNSNDPPDMSRTGMKVAVDKDGWRH